SYKSFGVVVLECQSVCDVKHGISVLDVVVGRQGDVCRIPADVRAVTVQHLGLTREPLGAAVEIGVIGVPGRGAERLALAAAGDPQRDPVPLERTRLDDRAVDPAVPAPATHLTGSPRLTPDLPALVAHQNGRA